jgi:clan AA aspartic protease (TIGR02281 family)
VVPLQRAGQHLLVQALLNGTVTAPLLVDTGASYTVLAPAVARQLALNLQNVAVMPMRSASGVFLAPLTKIKSLAVGEATVHDLEVIIHDAIPGLGGLLGMSFLEHFTVTTTSQALILAPPLETPGIPTYGGRSKDWWVRKFRFYRQNMESIQAYLSQQSSPQLEKTLRYFQAELNALERQASVAAVPRQWRY